MRHRRIWLAVTALTVVPEAAVVASRRGRLLDPRTIVRCRQGHLFTTLWVPGVSLKALRLGWWRLQRCPVGRHWSLVTPVRDAELSEADRQAAAAQRDLPLP